MDLILRKALEISNTHELMVRCIDYNQNKPHHIVTGGDDCMVRIWDTRHAKNPLKELSNHSHW